MTATLSLVCLCDAKSLDMIGIHSPVVFATGLAVNPWICLTLACPVAAAQPKNLRKRQRKK